MDTNDFGNVWKVYKHTSPSGKCYIGITHYEDPNIRWQNGMGYKGCPFFIPAILKYGWDNFTHEILFDKLSVQEACRKEKELITYYKNLGKSYNSADGGVGHTGPFTEEHRKHISESSKSGQEDVRKRISETLKSNHPIPWNKGKTGVYSEETLKKISDGSKGHRSWNKGKKTGPQSEEHRKKISEANKGKKKSDQKGKRKPYTEEHRKHISEGLKGKRLGIPLGPRPDEVKNKISKGRLGQKWVCKPWVQPKQIGGDILESYLKEGWKLGKIICIDSKKYKWNGADKMWVLI